MLCNSTEPCILFNRYIQFTIRIGSHSTVNTCPSGDLSHDHLGEVLLTSSCNAGTSWELLKQFDSSSYREPRSGCIFCQLQRIICLCRPRQWLSKKKWYFVSFTQSLPNCMTLWWTMNQVLPNISYFCSICSELNLLHISFLVCCVLVWVSVLYA